MSERPILFSSPMIMALLASRKTQTRRVLKNQETWERVGEGILRRWPNQKSGTPHKVGDRLWVREAFSYDSLDVDHDGFMPAWYWADGNPRDGDWTRPKPSIHMPRAYSRLTLTVTDVRVQRLQDISEEDAIAEGVDPIREHPASIVFSVLWDKINGPEAWKSNPWVCAVTFETRKGNIDE